MQLSIVVIGKPGGCKSTTIGAILREFERYQVPHAYISDRVMLEEAVVADVVNGVPYGEKPIGKPQPLKGEHSILFDGTKGIGQKQFQVTDGILLNQIHEKMVQIAATHRSHDILLFEYATGPNKTAADLVKDLPGVTVEYDVPLLQSGQDLIRLFSTFPKNFDQKIIIVEIDAGYEERFRRNEGRYDGMRIETFRTIFGDGGEIRHGEELERMGIDFVYVDNNFNDIELFTHRNNELCDTSIRPLIEQHGRGPEALITF